MRRYFWTCSAATARASPTTTLLWRMVLHDGHHLVLVLVMALVERQHRRCAMTCAS
jgi:hypothetical protein